MKLKSGILPDVLSHVQRKWEVCTPVHCVSAIKKHLVNSYWLHLHSPQLLQNAVSASTSRSKRHTEIVNLTTVKAAFHRMESSDPASSQQPLEEASCYCNTYCTVESYGKTCLCPPDTFCTRHHRLQCLEAHFKECRVPECQVCQQWRAVNRQPPGLPFQKCRICSSSNSSGNRLSWSGTHKKMEVAGHAPPGGSTDSTAETKQSTAMSSLLLVQDRIQVSAVTQMAAATIITAGSQKPATALACQPAQPIASQGGEPVTSGPEPTLSLGTRSATAQVGTSTNPVKEWQQKLPREARNFLISYM